MNSTNNKEVYPGMRVLATRLFKQTPVSERPELTRKLKLIFQNAKSKGVATKMNWANESLDSLCTQFLYTEPSNGLKRASNDVIKKNPKSKKPANYINSDLETEPETNEIESESLANSPVYESAPDTDNELSFQPSKQPAKQSKQAKQAKQSKQVKQVKPQSEKAQTSFFGFSIDTTPDPAYTKPAKRKNNSTNSTNSTNSANSSNSNNSKKSKTNTNTLQQTEAKSSREQRFQTKPAMMPYVDCQLTHTIIGTCQNIEKPYFRLTGQVNPAVVRPPEVLKQAVETLITNPRDPSYSYILDQLKAIRQDLTVQHIQTELTAEVYEFNVRVAIENNDIGEVNKCLTQLLHQFKEQPAVHKRRRYEFLAYSVYYRLYTNKWDELSVMLRQFYEDTEVQLLLMDAKNTTTTTSITGESTANSTANSSLKYPAESDCVVMYTRALELISLVQRQDIYAIYSSLDRAFALERVLMNYIAERVQLQVLKSVCTATFAREQVLPIKQLGVLLGNSGIDKTRKILTDLGIIVNENETVSSKQALERLSLVRNLDFVDLKGQK